MKYNMEFRDLMIWKFEDEFNIQYEDLNFLSRLPVLPAKQHDRTLTLFDHYTQHEKLCEYLSQIIV